VYVIPFPSSLSSPGNNSAPAYIIVLAVARPAAEVVAGLEGRGVLPKRKAGVGLGRAAARRSASVAAVVVLAIKEKDKERETRCLLFFFQEKERGFR
jgi:hypothetical protein